jgi:hypothetical protein
MNMPPPPADTLASELSLIDAARATLTSDPAATLMKLAEHQRLFPSGKLAIERELLALDALARLGRSAEESERAERLRPAVRGTFYEDRVASHIHHATDATP